MVPGSQTKDSGMSFPFYLGQEWSIDIKLYSNHAELHKKPVTMIPYRTKLFIGINVREIRDCQNRERFKPTKTNFQQALDA